MRLEVQMFLARAFGIYPALFEERVAEEASLQCGASCRLAFRLSDDVLEDLAHAKAIKGAQDRWDAILSFEADSIDQAEVQVRALADRVRGMSDGARSTVLATRRHAIVPGEKPVILSFVLRRLPHLAPPQFYDYWLNTHADYGRRNIQPPRSYAQLHSDAEASARLTTAAGFAVRDYMGVAECTFPSIADFQAQLQRVEVARDALADERNFIDHSRSVFDLFRVVPIN